MCAYLQQTDLYPEVAERGASACSKMGGGMVGGWGLHRFSRGEVSKHLSDPDRALSKESAANR